MSILEIFNFFGRFFQILRMHTHGEPAHCGSRNLLDQTHSFFFLLGRRDDSDTHRLTLHFFLRILLFYSFLNVFLFLFFLLLLLFFVFFFSLTFLTLLVVFLDLLVSPEFGVVRLQLPLSQIIDPEHAVQRVTDRNRVAVSHAVETNFVLFLWVIARCWFERRNGVSSNIDRVKGQRDHQIK